MRVRFLAAAMAVLLSCCGCSAFAGSDTAAADQPVRISTLYNLELLDPTRSTSDEILGSLFDALVEKGPDGSAQPGLATSWKSNADNTSWTFELRPGVKFQDGSPLDSDDVVFTYKKILGDKSSTVAAYVRGITDVKADGPLRVTFTLAKPALFTENGARVWIVPSDYYQKVGPDAFRAAPVGSGPYRLTGTKPGPVLTLTAYDGYWHGAATVKTAEISYITDENTVITALQSGALDVARLSPRGQQAVAGGALTFADGPSNQTFYIGFNTRNPVLADPRVRQAISLAVDRQAITTNLFGGKAKPIGQMVPPVVAGYDPSIPAPAFDPAQAKQLLAQAGYKGQPLRLDYPSADGIPQGEDVVQAIARNLADAGIVVQPVGTEASSFLKTWYVGGFDALHIYAYTTATASRAYSLLAQAAAYDTKPLLTMVDQVAAQPDAAKQVAGLQGVARFLVGQEDYAPLFNPQYTYVSSSRVVPQVRVDGYMRPYDMRPGS